jgi:DNA polymerase III gamma/tau subunit
MAHPQNNQRSSQRSASKKGGRQGSARQTARLTEARHLLSLRQLEPCLRVIQEVLREEPGNQAAKGLLELVTLQLLPKQEATQTVSATPPPAEHSPHRQAAAPGSDKAEKTEVASQFQFLLDFPFPYAEDPAGTSSGGESSPAPDPETMRERTISALVDLFQRKEKTLKDWQDPRFREASLSQATQPQDSHPPPSHAKAGSIPANPRTEKKSKLQSSAGFWRRIFRREKER